VFSFVAMATSWRIGNAVLDFPIRDDRPDLAAALRFLKDAGKVEALVTAGHRPDKKSAHTSPG